MDQADFERAVSRATGETRDYIRRMGFSLMVVPAPPAPPSEPTRSIRPGSQLRDRRPNLVHA